MSRYEWALFFHLVGAFLFVGGMVVAAAGHVSALGRRRPRDIAVSLGVGRIGVGLVGPGAVLVIGFGSWLVSLGGHEFGDAWVSAAYVLFLLAAVGGGLGGPRLRRARVLAERLTEDGAGDEPSPELDTLLRDRASALANYGAALLVLAVLVLMVWKPGA
jgi:uncharacterized membrane protein